MYIFLFVSKGDVMPSRLPLYVHLYNHVIKSTRTSVVNKDGWGSFVPEWFVLRELTPRKLSRHVRQVFGLFQLHGEKPETGSSRGRDDCYFCVSKQGQRNITQHFLVQSLEAK